MGNFYTSRLSEDELMHYGVLGMKWGQRRARINAGKAAKLKKKAKSLSSYDSKSDPYSPNDKSEKAVKYRENNNRIAKKYASKAEKYDAKAKKIEQKHRNRAGNATYDRVKKTSTGKLVGQTAVMGTYGALNYNRMRAKGHGRVASGVAGYASGVGDSLTKGGASILEPRVSAAVRKRKKNR